MKKPLLNRATALVAVVTLTLLSGSASRATSPPRLSISPLTENSDQLHSKLPSKETLPAAADAQNVEFVGHIGGETNAVAVQGDYAYIGVGLRLAVLNISDPTSPTVVGKTSPLPDIIRAVTVAGDYAYVTEWYGGCLRVVDVSTPSNPTEVACFDTPGHPADVAVAGSYAYVADHYAGLRVVDVSTPSNPMEVGFYDTLGRAAGVAVAGNYAYVADWYGGLRVLDVSTPSNPREAGFYDTPGLAVGVAVAGDYAYVADYDAGLRVVDVSTPSNPTEVGFYDTPGYACGVAVAGGYAYVADGDAGLVILRYTGGASTFSISGHVRDGSGNPISGVTVSAVLGSSATTDAGGAYTITGLTAGTYTLTPGKSGWTFSPPTRTVGLPPSAAGQDFVGTMEPSISYPVILVHGWQGFDLKGGGNHCTDQPTHWQPGTDSYLGQLPEWLSESGYDVWLANLETGPSGTPTFEENAQCLSKQVEYVAGDDGHLDRA